MAKPKTNRNIVEFEKRVKSTLWRQEPGKEKKSYDAWKARVNELVDVANAGYTHPQAVVQASKDYPCLARLFREYDLSTFDPNPDSHPATSGGNSDNGKVVVCKNEKLTYRQSLQWAITAAGAFLRTGEQPIECPCDAAWYLYEQARAEPKDFLGKVGQVESKGAGESEDVKNARKSGRRSIAEIDSMLAVLEGDDNERDDNSL